MEDKLGSQIATSGQQNTMGRFRHFESPYYRKPKPKAKPIKQIGFKKDQQSDRR